MMDDREVLEALLDGKIIVDESSWHDFHYKLIGNKVWVKIGECEWMAMDRILNVDLDCVRIEGEEEE